MHPDVQVHLASIDELAEVCYPKSHVIRGKYKVRAMSAESANISDYRYLNQVVSRLPVQVQALGVKPESGEA